MPKHIMHYTGIGSRNIPDDILLLMNDIGATLANMDYTLRSGGADGADTAFEIGCNMVNGNKEIYLPWKGFNDNQSNLYNIPGEAFDVAERIYGARWRNINIPVRQMMSRNILQVVGQTLDRPSDFVVCWTPDGCTTAKNRTNITGGTGQAIAYADSISVPVFNLNNEKDFDRLIKYIETIGVMKW